MEQKVEIIVHHTTPATLPPFHPGRPPGAMAVTVGQPDLLHIEAMAARSYQLAIERGHVRR